MELTNVILPNMDMFESQLLQINQDKNFDLEIMRQIIHLSPYQPFDKINNEYTVDLTIVHTACLTHNYNLLKWIITFNRNYHWVMITTASRNRDVNLAVFWNKMMRYNPPNTIDWIYRFKPSSWRNRVFIRKLREKKCNMLIKILMDTNMF